MKNNSVDIVYKKECTGCSVCYHACPHNAIEMIETKEGFHYPTVNEEKCTDCGLCVKKCHALNDSFKTDFKQQIYDVRANDEIRMKSSSGGMFTLLADYVFENNGYVCGASFTKDWVGVEHIIINDKKDLDKLRGSKYIESSLGNTFIEIKKLLNEKKQVLFTGCPCQVSALYSYLGKDYDNLLTIDLLCNSIVPQKVWVKYLKELFTDEEIKNIEYISFRDKKKFGWGAGIYFKLKNKEYVKNNSLYMKLFYEHTGVKEECLHCKYSRFKRCSDTTIADFWGSKKPDNKGISLVFINTLKGYNVFNKVKIHSKFKNIPEYKYPNAGLGMINYSITSSRKYFFDNLDKEPLEELYKNSNDTKYNIGIVSTMFQNNFGGVLTYYALFEFIKKIGFNPILVYNKFGNGNLNSNVKGCQIALKYLNIGNQEYNYEELYKLTNICSTFLIGSDIVWNYHNFRDDVFYYLLNFVNNTKKKISYSSSFGVDKYEGDYNHKLIFKHYLKQFDYVSVREDKGVDICYNDFNIKATHVLDPVFLLENDDYDYLINKSSLNINHKYILIYGYTIVNDKVLKLIDKVLLEHNMELIIIGDSESKYSIEDWLYLIKNASFIITDSFHGSCFSILFNKPFIAISGIAPLRLVSMFNMFDLNNRLLKNIDDINNINDFFEMDFEQINEKLELEKKKSLEWLINALETPKKINKDSYKDDMINLLIEKNQQLNNENKQLNNEIKENKNWIRLFGIYNNKNYIYIYIFGIKCVIKATEKNINRIAWWIPVRKWREDFRDKFRKLY